MKIDIIIPNFNGLELLEKNLPLLLKKTEKNKGIHITVIDDCSTDSSVEFLKKNEPKIKVIRNEKNIGFAKSVNKAVSQSEGEIVILLNSDVYPKNDFIEPLISHFADPSVFAVGCLDKSLENGKEIDRGRGIGKWERGFLVHAAGSLDKKDTLWVSGGSGAFRKSTWEKLGGFNTIYAPFYWEDIDLSYRALKSGYKTVFERQSVVVHEHEKGSIKTQYAKSFITSVAYRNQLLFVWLNVTDSDILLSHILWLPYHCIAALIRFDFSFLAGLLKAVLLMPLVVSERLKNKKTFVLGDKEVIKSHLE